MLPEEIPFSKEVWSLLDVLSRLAPIRAIVHRAAGNGLETAACFEDNLAFRELGDVLRKFQGSYNWILLSQMPYLCLVPTAPVGREIRNLSAKEAQSAAARDMRDLAIFVEKEFGLSSSPSLGLTITAAPISDNSHGPGGPALLVRDPRRYLSNNFLPTSPLDHQVDYWISDEEGDLMYEKLHSSERAVAELAEMPLLARVCKSLYEDLIILPGEVRALGAESRRMAESTPSLRVAMERIERICAMAAKNDLGIIVLGR